MYALALLTASLSFVSASPISSRQAPPNVVASVDRYAGASCTGTICNIAGSGDLVPGCNVIQDNCLASVSLNYANKGCTVTVYADDKCKAAGSVALKTPGVCSALKSTPFKSIYVKC